MQLTKNFGYFNVMQNKGVSKKINKALVNMSIHIMIKAIFKDNSEYDIWFITDEHAFFLQRKYSWNMQNSWVIIYICSILRTYTKCINNVERSRVGLKHQYFNKNPIDKSDVYP